MVDVVRYGDSESEKKLAKIQTCRDIVRSVIEYGVDQIQLLTIIRLLALELDDHEKIVQLVELVKSFEQNTLFIDSEESSGQ
jgi:uncharacterized Fe-S radical SAM superfamily protein PflX